MARASELFDTGDYSAALLICLDLAHQNPFTPGLTDLRRRIVSAMVEKQAEQGAQREGGLVSRMAAEMSEDAVVPDTYGLRRKVRGEIAPLRSPMNAMESMLRRPVTLHLDNVDLNAFVLAVGASENINIIADTIDSETTMTVHAENVALGEILDFASRNLGVSFFMGDNVIWATASQATPGPPLVTRIYRLRKGLPSGLITADGAPDETGIEAAVQRFVPAVEGSDLMFDANAQVLMVRNTRAGIGAIEEIIAALDVSPVQVLIEARFISTSMNDLSELGVDWQLDSAVGVTSETVRDGDGTIVKRNRTQIPGGKLVALKPFANEASGLNLTYQGLLTEPLYEAVLHALDESGKAKTLSVPKVTAINNNSATISVGEDFFYFQEFDTQSTPTISDDGTTVFTSQLVPVGTPTRERAGITLSVTPSIGSDLRTISLHLEPTITELVRFRQFAVGTGGQTSVENGVTNTGLSVIELPVIRISEVKTKALVQSGETVALGGLITTTESKDVSKVPVLGSLPLFGRLFRHDVVQEERKNLLIFVTATVISERGEDLVPLDWAPPADPAAPRRGE